MPRAWMLAGLAALAIAGCGSATSTAAHPAPASSSAPTPSTSTGGPCRRVPVPAPRPSVHLPVPTLRLDPARIYTVHVTTNCGSFAFTLDVRQSPRTSASFAGLVRRGFFNGLTFHRVAAGFVIQGGDPAGNGSGGPGYTIVEPPPAGTRYRLGDVAMAKTQTQPAGASGSQFFIVTAADAGLPPDYALLGKVVAGMAVVQTIGRLPTSPPQDGAPTPAVVMSRVTLTTS